MEVNNPICNGPVIIVNFKNTKNGKEVLIFSKEINNSCLIVAIPTVNLSEVARNTDLIVISQNLNDITPQALKKTGAQGTLLNHSDHPLELDEIKRLTKECNKLKLKVIVCVKNFDNMNEIIKFKPWGIAYEDPKFIGTKNAITNYPTNLLKFMKYFKDSKSTPLCGAGINKTEDVENALKLGFRGVLVSSAVMNSKNPKVLLKKLSLF
ncbi:MAG TPA: triose-phosphate isomerase [Candidatus Pacearchaeota archaeon]|jgi:triosephosphate isomerase|nr:triose-phosphate isomerase [Candidatus Pacearchaeota archaeon]